MRTGNKRINVSIAASSQELMQEATALLVNNAHRAIEVSGRFCTAISRHTAKPFLEKLAADSAAKSLPWNKIHLFCVDECYSTFEADDNGYNTAASVFRHRAGIYAVTEHIKTWLCSIVFS